MSYRIVWQDEQIRKIGDQWAMMSPQRQRELSYALDDIDHQLKNLPHTTGESRFNMEERILVQRPLVIWFRINDRLKVSQIFSAHLID